MSLIQIAFWRSFWGSDFIPLKGPDKIFHKIVNENWGNLSDRTYENGSKWLKCGHSSPNASKIFDEASGILYMTKSAIFFVFWVILSHQKGHLITTPSNCVQIHPSSRRWLGVQFSFVDEKTCDEASPIAFLRKKNGAILPKWKWRDIFSLEMKQTTFNHLHLWKL